MVMPAKNASLTSFAIIDTYVVELASSMITPAAASENTATSMPPLVMLLLVYAELASMSTALCICSQKLYIFVEMALLAKSVCGRYSVEAFFAKTSDLFIGTVHDEVFMLGDGPWL